MAYKETNIVDRGNAETQGSDVQTLQFNGETAILPHESYVRDADFSRDGSDLVMNGPEGTLIVEDYFAGLESPTLIGPSGASLTPELVNSFTSSGNEYAQSHSMTDASPVGAVDEISGNATITRLDGSQEKLSMGTPVFQGDVIETDAGAAVNVAFIDDSSFAVSEETRLAIDEYVFDPSSQGGVQNFSVLKGVFVYTSGLIGREDPDDVSIDTPVGSIGIRGTIIAGDVDNAEITVIEGAIVLRDAGGNEMTLASQFETGKFLNEGRGIINLGQKSAGEVAENFSKVSGVAPELFSSINDAANENQGTPQKAAQDGEPAPVDAKQPVAEESQEFDANGATDKNGDSEVDGTVEEAPADAEAKEAAPEGEEAKEAALEEAAESEAKPTIQVIEDPLGVNQEVLPNNSLGNTQTVTAAVANEAIDDFENGNGDSNNGNGQKRGLLKQLLADQNEDNSSTTDSLDDPGNLATGGGGGNAGTANSAPISLDPASIGTPIEALSGVQSYTMRIFASELFIDPDGDPLSFDLTTTTFSDLSLLQATSIIDSYNWDSSNGILAISFDSGLASNGDFDIIITAEDPDGEINGITLNIDYDVADHVMSSSVTNVVGANGDTVSVIGTNVIQTNYVNGTIYRADPGATQITHDDTTFHGSTNNDNVLLTAGTSGTTLYLEHGNDFADIQDVQEHFEAYGMGGDDTFRLSNTVYNDLEGNNRNFLIDGGAVSGDQDVIQLAGGGNINFMNILARGNEIKNIDDINAVNSGGDNIIRLDFGSIIEMTEGDNKLRIIGDSDGSDTVELLNFSADGITGGQISSDSGFTRYEFTDGTDTVRLVIDNDINTGNPVFVG